MTDKRWVILSPHLDDGILSCGGLIEALRGSAPVEVWTIFCRASRWSRYSEAAKWLHRMTGFSSGMKLYTRRRQEDQRACEMLGAKFRHMPWLDAPYRKASDGSSLYMDTRGQGWHREEEQLIKAITKKLRAELKPSDIVLCPLGLGSHVDHRIVRHAVEDATCSNLAYYADFPYVETHDSLHRLTDHLDCCGYELTQPQVDRWMEAVECYTTQIKLLEEMSGGIKEMIASYASGDISLYASDSSHALDDVEAGMTKAGISFHREKGNSGRSRESRKSVTPQTNVKIGGSTIAFAPIAIFAFRRLDLLQVTLDSLERCDGFAHSEITVFSDGARDGRPEEAAEVARLRAWLRNWCATWGATLQESPVNRGLRASIVSGINQVLENHDRVIVVEDDLMVSRDFLSFMNEALETFKDREDISQVSGYMVPHSARLKPIGLLRAPSSWGWGTWRRAWKHYRDDPAQLAAEVRNKDPHAFDIDGTYGYLEALERNAAGTLDTWAVRWYASSFLRGTLSIHPDRTLVRNVGFGDDGTNCKPGPMARKFAKQKIRHGRPRVSIKALDEAETPEYAEALREFYRWQQREWTKPSFSARVRGSLGRFVPRAE